MPKDSQKNPKNKPNLVQRIKAIQRYSNLPKNYIEVAFKLHENLYEGDINKTTVLPILQLNKHEKVAEALIYVDAIQKKAKTVEYNGNILDVLDSYIKRADEEKDKETKSIDEETKKVLESLKTDIEIYGHNPKLEKRINDMYGAIEGLSHRIRSLEQLREKVEPYFKRASIRAAHRWINTLLALAGLGLGIYGFHTSNQAHKELEQLKNKSPVVVQQLPKEYLDRLTQKAQYGNMSNKDIMALKDTLEEKGYPQYFSDWMLRLIRWNNKQEREIDSLKNLIERYDMKFVPYQQGTLKVIIKGGNYRVRR